MSTSILTTITEMTKTSLTVDDIQNILTLIDFHDDWDEVKDVWGFDIEPLFNKLNDMLQDAWDCLCSFLLWWQSFRGSSYQRWVRSYKEL